MSSIRDRRAEPTTATINDADGAPHDYIITPHSTTAATPLLLALGKAFAPLLTQAAAARLRVQGMDAELGLSELMSDPALVGSMGDKAGQALGALDPELIPRLFAFTLRDGQPMSNRGNYDAAYAGNAVELVQAAVQIISTNRFVPF